MGVGEQGISPQRQERERLQKMGIVGNIQGFSLTHPSSPSSGEAGWCQKPGAPGYSACRTGWVREAAQVWIICPKLLGERWASLLTQR